MIIHESYTIYAHSKIQPLKRKADIVRALLGNRSKQRRISKGNGPAYIKHYKYVAKKTQRTMF